MWLYQIYAPPQQCALTVDGVSLHGVQMPDARLRTLFSSCAGRLISSSLELQLLLLLVVSRRLGAEIFFTPSILSTNHCI